MQTEKGIKKAFSKKWDFSFVPRKGQIRHHFMEDLMRLAYYM